MAKSLTVNTSHTFMSKGTEHTLSDLLQWADEHLCDEETEEPKYSPADLMCIGVLRLKALHKDAKRHEAGKLPQRFYVPRIDNLEKVPAPLKALVDEGERVEEKYAPEKPAPKAKPAKASKPRKVEKTIAKPVKQAKPKASKPAPAPKVEAPPAAPPKPAKAKPPTVRKVEKPAPVTPPVEAKPVEPIPASKPASKATEEFTMMDGKLMQVSK